MNKAKLKSYAPQARKDFIAAVTARANLLGLSEKAGKLEVATSQPQGDATVIAGQAWPVKVHSQRQQLIARIQKDGFAQTMEAVAYTWFNRFAALRYMELHDYLGHGHRALSSLEGTLPDILTHAADLAQGGDGGLPGLKPALVVEMKLAGNRDGELYRLLLVSQCNALSNVMPFLFERIDDETELLLPDNLLRTDSVIAKLVTSIDEEDWAQVEIIGWLYQFYISEKKDEVIGKVVKSEDIPAATQLFTPNWIVQYLVQNSVGRLWLMANPTSTLKAQWPYYITPADQTPEVQAQLDALIQTRVNEDGDSLNPESITLLDPACGSGHILVEAYELLKAIYLERGYQPRSIPRLILEKNLYGLDIDDRAAQMAGFALLMKARADDRRLFIEPIKLNVLSLQESKGLDADVLARALQINSPQVGPQIETNIAAREFCRDDLFPGTHPQISLGEFMTEDKGVESVRFAIEALIGTFTCAKTFGSLIQIRPTLNAQLMSVATLLQSALSSGDLYAKAAAQDLLPLVAQARILGMKVDAVVANPPYMGGKGMHPILKDYVKTIFPDSKADLFAMFIERGFGWCKPSSFNSMVTMQSWMFLSSYQAMREKLLRERTIHTMAHLGARAFSEISGEVVQTTAFVLQGYCQAGFKPVFLRLVDGIESSKRAALLAGLYRHDNIIQNEFNKVPGSCLAYWVSTTFLELFKHQKMSDIGSAFTGLQTGDTASFLRRWYEVSLGEIGFGSRSRVESLESKKRWFPCNKGGESRKWYGNHDFVVDWRADGKNIKERKENDLRLGKITANNSKCWNQDYYFRGGVSWSMVSTGDTSFRYFPDGFVFDIAAPTFFLKSDDNYFSLGFLNSKVSQFLASIFSPTVNFVPGVVHQFPLPFDSNVNCEKVVKSALEIAMRDWDSNENSWNFKSLSWVNSKSQKKIKDAWEDFNVCTSNIVLTMKSIEEENNTIFINAYGLQNELSPAVLESKITLARADREKDCQRLVSYAIGCMMGRYSLDSPGLIYADSGNINFDDSCYVSFPADSDGIVPLTDELWFEDEAASRIREFLLAVWGVDALTENMVWLAESLGTKAGETPDETIRRYLADKFYKDHLQTYKKRPIYWLFSSGKQGAFQALVYLHRYHEGTLSRMRAEYVVPLSGKIQSRIDMLEKDAAAASSTAGRNKLAKEVEKLKKKHVELLAYDEQLRHHADMRITLDLDDGVKVNYGKFGDLLAEVKAVTGGASDD
ncbi:BREX-1 system adenine-specific DNA-methyltransferase PglX [Rugamonas sp. DEMB1]|uniref:BREX-1 system adenine-specific DNA-methyltransferase PglX n=1 Tax=Rugamonas sp. DEMB1 TaxID=3039386 RepID=UPI002446903A|nr:BREX-1 system adenine-specific DNA-methyltransferase PglX [Rugamonas sp. DEMB1]WGG48878.1 BREX-1 system adenine-specific DNA-methyltransferase PglX [Rugamonas sp. DEMB1]